MFNKVGIGAAPQSQVVNGPLFINGSLTVAGAINQTTAANQMSQGNSTPSLAPWRVQNLSNPAYSGMTSIITTPTVAVVGLPLAMGITWDYQSDLLAWDHDELQVSADDTNWYSLDTTMLAGGLGVLNAETEVTDQMFVQPLAASTTLYYRVRRVTYSSGAYTYGTWAGAMVGTSLASGGSVGIGAMMIYCGLLLAGNINFTGEVASQTNVTPQNGDLRSIFSKSSIEFDQYNVSVALWQTLAKIGPGAASNLADLFVSGRGFANDAFYSAPGRAWVQPTALGATAASCTALVFGQSGVGIALVGYSSPHAVIYRSTDGVTWNTVTSPFSAGYVVTEPGGLATDGAGNWVATTSKNGSAPQIAYSTNNGATWSLATHPFGSGDFAIYVAYGNGIWVAGGRIAGNTSTSTSANLSSWTSLVSCGIATLTSIVYGGSTGFLALGGGVTDYAMATSVSGTVWTAVSVPSVGGYFTSAAYGNGTWCIGTQNATSYTAPASLSSFTLATLPAGITRSIDAVTFGNGMFVMCDNGGNTARSLDLGNTWGTYYGDNASSVPSGVEFCLGATFAPSYGYGGRFYLFGEQLVTLLPVISYSDYQEAGSGIQDTVTNANGTAIKFANGLMYCETVAQSFTTTTASGNIFYSGSANFDWPVAFVALLGGPQFHTITTAGIVIGGASEAPTLTQIVAAIGVGSTNGTAGTISFGQWGYWK